MAQGRVAIIGTGLIGTSIGLRLMTRKDRGYDVVGADRDRENLRAARKLGALDREAGSLEEALDGAGLVILALPVLAARHTIESMTPYIQPGAVVTDTCSTKADIMRWAAEFLPEEVHFVGGHPMAGREKSGPEAAQAGLFEGATWAITPSPRADEGAVRVVLGLVEAAGATPLFIDPGEHDQYTAAISHLPILLSVGLFRMVRDSAGWDDAALLAGPAFRDLTRLASGDPTMSADIMNTNREAVVHWLHRFRQELAAIEQAIETGGDPVKDLFASTQLDRDAFMLNPPARRLAERATLPSAQDAVGQLFVGSSYDKLRDIMNRSGRSDDPRDRPKR